MLFWGFLWETSPLAALDSSLSSERYRWHGMSWCRKISSAGGFLSCNPFTSPSWHLAVFSYLFWSCSMTSQAELVWKICLPTGQLTRDKKMYKPGVSGSALCFECIETDCTTMPFVPMEMPIVFLQQAGGHPISTECTVSATLLRFYSRYWKCGDRVSLFERVLLPILVGFLHYYGGIRALTKPDQPLVLSSQSPQTSSHLRYHE